MTLPIPTDPASEVITEVMNTLLSVFGADSPLPPIGGPATEVRFFYGDAAALGEIDCGSPILWVRLDSRYRSEAFPEQTPLAAPCGATDVIALEVGLARCAGLDDSRQVMNREAEVALDDSWHFSQALCLLHATLKTSHQFASEPISPYGPEGGIIVWATTLYIGV